MLVLTRKKEETILIGEGPDQITLTVVQIQGDKVRIGVSAPKHVPVHRQEVAKRIEQSRRGGFESFREALEEMQRRMLEAPK